MNRLLTGLTGLAVVATIFAFTSKNKIESAEPASIREVLLDQLKSTHNQKDWFVPVNTAIEGLTPEQANWQDQGKIHSVGQLIYHLIYWNERQLAKFKGEKEAPFSGNNDETFTAFDKNTWTETVAKLDRDLTEWERLIATTDEAKLKSWYTTISRINTHNAYHTGEIIYVRKLQGSWNPEKGVK
jgi:hypothetical protein